MTTTDHQMAQPTDGEGPLSPPARRWQDRAACRGLDTEMFFPKRGELVAEAMAICDGCSVRPDCLEHALSFAEHFGIWGGTSERRRRRIRASRRTAVEESAA